MIFGRSILALIPARGGSKRLPGKNLRPLNGRPLIRWTVDVAKKARTLDTVAVTTDDPAIIAAVSNLCIQIVDRPKELAADKSSVYDAIFHALDFFPMHDYVMLLQPTSPLRLADDIDAAAFACVSMGAPSIISTQQGVPVPNGAIYMAWVSWLREHRQFDGGRTIVYPMPAERSVDIDRLEDFERAEKLMASRCATA